jgi:hypothetical protein
VWNTEDHRRNDPKGNRFQYSPASSHCCRLLVYWRDVYKPLYRI